MKPVITSIRDCKSGFFGHASFLKQELGAVKWYQSGTKFHFAFGLFLSQKTAISVRYVLKNPAR